MENKLLKPFSKVETYQCQITFIDGKSVLADIDATSEIAAASRFSRDVFSVDDEHYYGSAILKVKVLGKKSISNETT